LQTIDAEALAAALTPKLVKSVTESLSLEVLQTHVMVAVAGKLADDKDLLERLSQAVLSNLG
jgi:hypothetical protein